MPIAFTYTEGGITVQFGFQIPEAIAEEVFPNVISDWKFYATHTAIATREGTTQLDMYQELVGAMASKMQEWELIIQEALIQKRQNAHDTTEEAILGVYSGSKANG